MIVSGPMESVTTVRQDYSHKYMEKPEIIIPCGNIRLSSGKLDAHTTAKLSYADPGCTELTINFKPIVIYCPPSEPILHDTTQKLSYQPVHIGEKDTYFWQQKPIYKYILHFKTTRKRYDKSYYLCLTRENYLLKYNITIFTKILYAVIIALCYQTVSGH